MYLSLISTAQGQNPKITMSFGDYVLMNKSTLESFAAHMKKPMISPSVITKGDTDNYIYRMYSEKQSGFCTSGNATCLDFYFNDTFTITYETYTDDFTDVVITYKQYSDTNEEYCLILDETCKRELSRKEKWIFVRYVRRIIEGKEMKSPTSEWIIP